MIELFFPFLLVIGLGLLLFGIAYAVLIYYRPFDHGWTWLSVVIGVMFTEIGIWLAITITVVMISFYWWIIFYPLVGWLLTGLPMIVLQVFKYYKEKRDDEILKNKVDHVRTYQD